MRLNSLQQIYLRVCVGHIHIHFEIQVYVPTCISCVHKALSQISSILIIRTIFVVCVGLTRIHRQIQVYIRRQIPVNIRKRIYSHTYHIFAYISYIFAHVYLGT